MATASPDAPALFVSHGSPMVALDDDEFTGALRAWAARIPRPEAVLAVSAHWQVPGPVRVTTGAAPRTIHDFSGFPDALYALRYPAPGSAAVAERVLGRLADAGIGAGGDPARGLDHGAWIPLRALYPDADVPVVALSLPAGAPPRALVALGAALAPLRDEGILVMGSGGLVHNLARLDPRPRAGPVPWAGEFDEWVRARLAPGGEALLGYAGAAPHVRLAVPSSEHFDPVFVVLGAGRPADRVVDVYAGFRHGSLSMRSFALCP